MLHQQRAAVGLLRCQQQVDEIGHEELSVAAQSNFAASACTKSCQACGRDRQPCRAKRSEVQQKQTNRSRLLQSNSTPFNSVWRCTEVFSKASAGDPTKENVSVAVEPLQG
jgi:hypothetical protein